MLRAKLLLAVLLALTIGAYVMDCTEMMTLDDAMKCCDTMPCAPHQHGDAHDCCKTMSLTHTVFVQPSVHRASFSPVLVALVPFDSQAGPLEFSFPVTSAHSHAPPISDASIFSPLRV
jgi:hypothetical protein